jgi:hypothetical protein
MEAFYFLSQPFDFVHYAYRADSRLKRFHLAQSLYSKKQHALMCEGHATPCYFCLGLTGIGSSA